MEIEQYGQIIIVEGLNFNGPYKNIYTFDDIPKLTKDFLISEVATSIKVYDYGKLTEYFIHYSSEGATVRLYENYEYINIPKQNFLCT